MKILVAIYSPFAAWNIPDVEVDRLRRDFPHHTFHHARTEGDVRPLLAQADIAFAADLPAQHFDAAARLRWIHSPAAGIGNMLFPALVASPVVLSNSRGLSADHIAEHALGLVIGLFRKLPLTSRAQAARHWSQDEVMEGPLRTISGARVLLVGLGHIGAACAWRFAALGATVSAVRRRTGEAPPPGVSDVADRSQLPDVLPHADVVIVTAPETHETRGLIGRAAIAAMKKDAVLINVSRGKLVDEAALIDALRAGAIGGAGLDVFEQEPLDPASPLWTLPNVMITPHMAGFRGDHWRAATDMFADNLRRFESGQPLLNVVDKLAGY